MNKYIILMFVVALLAACEKEPVTILTLGKAGDYFYFGEKVQVWTGVDADLHHVTYDWECTGGQFDGVRTQHLFENLWIAPDQPGEYLITVTAHTATDSDVRQTKMKVTGYFAEDFDYGSKNPAGWASSNTTLAYEDLNVNGTVDKVVRVPATSNSSNPQLRRSMTGVPLTPPFSVRTKMMYAGYKAVTGANDVTTANYATYLSLTFVQPTTNPEKPYIREIRWEFCPPVEDTKKNWRLRMESYTPATGKSAWATANGNNMANPAPFFANTIDGWNELFSFAANTFHTFSMTIDADWKFSAYVDGIAFVEKSDALKSFVADNVLMHLDMKVNQFQLNVPRKSASSAPNTEMAWVVSRVDINDKNSAIGGDVNNIGFEELK
ncbi:MAG: hypothetical protein LBG28_02220 [Tannerella sp.]|jgi:hypothetical protein|nr:hypothetical protein [Tannerella sp.]